MYDPPFSRFSYTALSLRRVFYSRYISKSGISNPMRVGTNIDKKSRKTQVEWEFTCQLKKKLQECGFMEPSVLKQHCLISRTPSHNDSLIMLIGHTYDGDDVESLSEEEPWIKYQQFDLWCRLERSWLIHSVRAQENDEHIRWCAWYMGKASGAWQVPTHLSYPRRPCNKHMVLCK